MKLDLDCVRDILLGLESTLEYNDSGALSDGYTIQKLLEDHHLKNYSKAQVLYTLRLMVDAKLVCFAFIPKGNDFFFKTSIGSGITFEGHQYLASVRDSKVWSQTKRKLASIGGTATLSFVTAVSEGVAKALLAKTSLI